MCFPVGVFSAPYLFVRRVSLTTKSCEICKLLGCWGLRRNRRQTQSVATYMYPVLLSKALLVPTWWDGVYVAVMPDRGALFFGRPMNTISHQHGANLGAGCLAIRPCPLAPASIFSPEIDGCGWFLTRTMHMDLARGRGTHQPRPEKKWFHTLCSEAQRCLETCRPQHGARSCYYLLILLSTQTRNHRST